MFGGMKSNFKKQKTEEKTEEKKKTEETNTVLVCIRHRSQEYDSWEYMNHWQ